MLFFSVTGLTLNHPDALGSAPIQKEQKGEIPLEWVRGQSPKKLEIVERLRAEYGVRGSLDDFREDDIECSLSFKGPGYAAEAIISRESGALSLTTTLEGAMAVMNDLHKGRYSGSVWSWVIDISAVFLTLVSLTGIGLFCYLKKLRVPGVIVLVVGGAIVAVLMKLTLR